MAASGIDLCILYPYMFVKDPVTILHEHLMLYRLRRLFVTSGYAQIHW